MDSRSKVDLSAGTRTSSPPPSFPHHELPDKLIEFMLLHKGSSEPPPKRQKVAPRPTKPQDVTLEYIVVKQSSWEIKFEGSKLSDFDIPLEKPHIRPYVHWNSSWVPQYLEIVDASRCCLFRAPLAPEDISDDLHIALLVHLESKKWAKLQGRIWTDFTISLIQKDGCDTFVLNTIIKWNITSGPQRIHQATSQPKALSQMMRKYFPDRNLNESETWSPQDFYKSVHVPDKNDSGSASIDVGGLESDLYPFQKRAVRWLLRREGVSWSPGIGISDMEKSDEVTIPLSFQQVKDDLGQTCFVSHVLGVVTLDVKPFQEVEQVTRGGILAEEMGLGKTVEMISLITLHRRPPQVECQIYDNFTAQSLRATGATLIITPPSILQQWISEINKHAPQLKVMTYEGIKAHRDQNFDELVDMFASSDIVISTYSVLAAEIHFTPLNPEKTLRHASKYPRPKSPLMQLYWWRCLIDEAQMIESGVSNAAVVARMIPRTNAWCVTGTPIRKDVKDLLGLLVFLRYEPYCSIKHVWRSLISAHKYEFRKLFGQLALRHSKQSVRDELTLPKQNRMVITMPFTPVEEQLYQELFEEACADVGLDANGAPLSETWNLDAASESMRRWLVRLRKTALHPEVGGRNRKDLRQRDGPLRTVDQVLEAMIEQADALIRTDQRALLTFKLKRGQLLENSPRVKEALAIWDEVVHEAAQMVVECRDQLQEEILRAQSDEASKGKISEDMSENESDVAEEQDDVDISFMLGMFQNRLRSSLEVLHMAVFFRANAYFQIKSNKDMTVPGSPEFEALEKLETDGYEEAKKLRREILKDIFRKAENLMRKISRRAATQMFVEVPEFSINIPKSGIESLRIMKQVDMLASALDAQANVVDEWREATIQLLLKNLVDEDEGVEVTGDEYEDSTKIQDEVMVYVQALGAVIVDRHDALTGQENNLIELDVKLSLRLANEGEGPFPEKTIDLLGIRSQIKPPKEMGSIRGFVAELRWLSASLKTQARGGNTRAQSELIIVQEQLERTQKQLSIQSKATAALEKEVSLFTKAMNTRMEYYRQLQHVSDTVAPYEGPADQEAMNKFIEEERKLQNKVAAAKSKRRYLNHLKMEATNPEEQRICVICREDFEVGALTVCGHQYCKECIRLWWKQNHSCPICKRRLVLADIHEITYKPQELTLRTEDVHTRDDTSPTKLSQKSAIYSEIDKIKLSEIKNVELDGPSFTTKVDTLVRHLIWLRESDPGSKSIIFSQFKEFLRVLAGAFKRHRIEFSSIDKPDGIERFKHDPAVECFLLHAKAHSSGLNLVNASHVFLCEPLLNTGLELQAIARVDRIGQHQETNVWLYLVDGTVEESIYQLSVKRRMEHIDQRLSQINIKGKQIANELSDTTLDEANSLELQQAPLASLVAEGDSGGEIIQKEDLWDCLFGSIEKRNASRALIDHELGRDEEVRRHLRAEAAEGRANGSGN